MESGKGCKGSTNAVEPLSAYGKGHDIETNGFGPDTGINRNINYGLKAADPSYGVSNKPIGDYQLGTNNPSRNYVTGTSRTGMAAGAEENIWLKAGNGTGVSGTPGRKVPGSLGSTGLDIGKPKVPDVPEIAGRGTEQLKEIYNSIRESPNYPEGFQMRTNGTTTNNVKNQQLLEKLREIEMGTWKKVYKDGYDAFGNRISIHYFQSQSGRVFDVKVKKGWSN